MVDAIFKWVVDGSAITTPVKADMTLVKIASQKSEGIFAEIRTCRRQGKVCERAL